MHKVEEMSNFFGPKSTLLNFARNLFIKFFLKLYLIKDIKKWAKVALLDFEVKFILCYYSYYAVV